MTQKLVVVLLFAMVVMTAPRDLSAQGQPGRQGGGGGQADAPRPSGIDFATAKKMMAAAEAQMVAQKANGAIAIVDALNGDLVLFTRFDGATQVGTVSAEGKARAALLFGVSTTLVAESIRAGKPLPLLITTPAAAGGIWGRMVNVSTNAGGMLIRRDGKVVGAIGVGGAGGGELDDRVAIAGLKAIGAM